MEKSLNFEIGKELTKYMVKLIYFTYMLFTDILFNKSNIKTSDCFKNTK